MEYIEMIDNEIQDIWSRIAESTAMPEENETDEDDAETSAA